MTMWRHSDPVEKDVPELPGIDLQNKRRRSRRAWRDGLAHQTVVRHLENVRSYRAFERAFIASVDPRSVLELTLVHRLASLLWRLRRASAIETGLLEMQGEILSARRQHPSHGPGQPATLQTPAQANGGKIASGSNGRDDPASSNEDPVSTLMRPPLAPSSKSSAIAQYFLRLSKLDPNLLDRVGSYEAKLWRQAAQTIWTLEAMRQPPPGRTRRFRNPVVLSYWDAERSR
jgi:hypothetical protein